MRNQRADRVFALYQALRNAQELRHEVANAEVLVAVEQELQLALNQAERAAWRVVQEVWRREQLNGQQYEEVVA